MAVVRCEYVPGKLSEYADSVGSNRQETDSDILLRKQKMSNELKVHLIRVFKKYKL